jgi:CTP synthase
MKLDLMPHQTLFMHLTLLPFLKSAGETKTKPTQRSVKEMLSHGLQPDILVCRSDEQMEEEERRKIALFTNVNRDSVISMPDVDSIYKIPIELNYQKVDEIILEKLKFKSLKKANLNDWKRVIKEDLEPKESVKISMVGKYTDLADAYKSLNEALKHGGFKNNLKVDIDYVDSEKLNLKNVHNKLKNSDAVLVPGGFGERGIEGMVCAVQYARTKLIPYLGICLGMQIAVIEFARNVAKLKSANSTEFNDTTKFPVVGLISEWLDLEGSVKRRDSSSDLGGTMRLGAQECHLEKNSLTRNLYKKSKIKERHRHRYEVNNNLIDALTTMGLSIVGKSADKMLVEVIEIKTHPWFVGCQFHPEFTSDPRKGHPLFAGFIKAAKMHKYKK